MIRPLRRGRTISTGLPVVTIVHFGQNAGIGVGRDRHGAVKR
jgi:hypothetical protein